MREFWRKHRTMGWILAALAVCGGLAAYVYALLLPGVWYGDTFLYRQEDGSFRGEDIYARYQMEREKVEGGREITFRVNEAMHTYRLLHDRESRKTEIYEDRELKFSGEVWITEGIGLYIDDDGEIVNTVEIVVGQQVPEIEDLFPRYTTLLTWSLETETETRGEPLMLIGLLVLAAVLALDIRYPDLFFKMRYSLAVDGGEPSDLYRMGQKLGRAILVICMMIWIGASFSIH